MELQDSAQPILLYQSLGIAVLPTLGNVFLMWAQKAPDRLDEPRRRVIMRENKLNAGPIGGTYDDLSAFFISSMSAKQKKSARIGLFNH